ncbi:MAG TPA: fused MFS/spermidine synthase [Lacunisphaera sp.]|nr:fused MFS/spermidine synthase [Lacunisphaera sp.]
MKLRRLFALAIILPAVSVAAEQRDAIEHFDTPYNSLTIERKGTLVEMRARSRRGEALESAVDLSDPLQLVVPYTRSLYAGLFFQPKPTRVLMIGLGGAGFHRFFAASFPKALLQTVELDPKVFELAQSRLGFAPTERTPVALADGRMFVKRDRAHWDWIILDAFRGGYVPAHLKTEEFYRECAARLDDRGVFISNLHSGTELYFADIRTIQAVFPQVVLFATEGRGNVILCAVKYREPRVTDPAHWPNPAGLLPPEMAARLDLAAVRAERIEVPAAELRDVKVLTDDFAPVEFLDTVKTNNSAPR